MQTVLMRGKAAFHMRRVGLSAAILTAVPLIVSLATPNQAYAGCGVSHPSGVHAASTSTAAHSASGISAASGGGSGCSAGVSTSPLKGLPTTSSGKVVETGGSHATREAKHERTAATKMTNASAHLRGVKAPHHG